MQPTLHATSVDMMQDLLQQFQAVFMKPRGLLLPHTRCHQICLQAITEPVAVCPYRYTHVQKARAWTTMR
jgi:hypothetical protein